MEVRVDKSFRFHYICTPMKTIPKDQVPDYVLDLKRIRNAIYAVGDGKNPYERDVLLGEACAIVHDITEKWKNGLRKTKP